MGVRILDGQAVNVLGARSYCIPDTEWSQPVMEGDCTSWQMDLSPKNDIEIFENPNFDTVTLCPTGWTCSGLAFGSVNSTAQLLPNGTIQQDVTLIDGAYYRLCVDIIDVDGGMELTVLAANSTFQTPVTTNKLGQFCVYFYANGTSDTIFLATNGVAGFVILNSASIKEISTPQISLETCDGDTVAATFELQVYKERAQAKLCWEGLDNGCYKICINPIELSSVNILDGANGIITNGGRRIITNSLGAITWIP